MRARKMYDEAAKERQKAGLKKGDKKPVVDNCPEREDAGRARDQVGEAVGETEPHTRRLMRSV